MILFLALSILHVIVFLWLHFQWRGIPERISIGKSANNFSILIPVRDEEKNIRNLLLNLNNQTYPSNQFEVLVIDDQSSDQTATIVQSMVEEVRYDLRYISANQAGKKLAITAGVDHAKYDFIITTDGDCGIGSEWISAYDAAYSELDAVMLTGPVRMSGSGFFSYFQQVEFSSLIGFGAAALHSGNPSMCNGANMSYKKLAFLDVSGYSGNEQIPTGDDEFLLQKLHGAHPGEIHFLRDKRAIVNTPSKASIKELLNQRIRWSSKWKYHKSWFIKASAIGVFSDYVVYIVAVLLTLSGIWSWQISVPIFLTRWIADLIYMFPIGRFLGLRKIDLMIQSLAIQILYPLLVTLLGIASIFGKYSWKGRHY